MAITLADFTKIWASTSPLTPYSFSESNYKEGWNFIGGTPPSRQMWDSIQNQNDEKLKYIVDNFLPLDGGTMTGAIVLADGGNPLSTAGGTMTGAISFDATGQIGYRATTHTEPANPCKQLIVSSTDIDHWSDEGGAKITLHTYDSTQTNTDEDGAFCMLATDGTNGKELKGKPNGDFTWGNKKIATNNWTEQNLVPTVSYTLASWGFCKIAYNENLAIISISGLKLTNTYTSPTTIFNLPVSIIGYYAGILYVDSSLKVCTCTPHSTYFEINGYSTANSYIYGNITVPVA